MKKTSPIFAKTGSDKSPAPIPGELCPDEMALLRGEGNAVENQLYRIKDVAKIGEVFGRSIVVHVNDIHSAGEVNEKRQKPKV